MMNNQMINSVMGLFLGSPGMPFHSSAIVSGICSDSFIDPGLFCMIFFFKSEKGKYFDNELLRISRHCKVSK